jgi:phosphoglycolate phosphatase-like HAD superfamily hydrolase
LLWDIDGTLVYMDRAGERALLVAIRELYGRDLGLALPVDLRGRTDTSIMRDLLAFLDVAVTPEEQTRFRLAYLSHMPVTMPAGKARVLAGIREALDAVHAHPEIHQALLTGNLKEGAKLNSARSPTTVTSAMSSGPSRSPARKKNSASSFRPSASTSSATRRTTSPAARRSA